MGELVCELRRDRTAFGFGPLDQFDTRALDQAEWLQTALEDLDRQVVFGAGRVQGALARRRVETGVHVGRSDVGTIR